MLGPLPRLHRLVVCAVALLTCAGVGAWVAFTLPVPVLASGGAAVGASCGLLLVGLLLREPPPARPQRERRRRR